MSDREFENYLTIISRLLRLSRGQEQAIGEELRDHFESRVAELTARGVGRDDAVRTALEEFGDAAGLAAQFSNITRTRKRRLIMRCTVASVTALAAAVVVAMAVWPENHAGRVVNNAVAQSGEKPKVNDPFGPSSEKPATNDPFGPGTQPKSNSEKSDPSLRETDGDRLNELTHRKLNDFINVEFQETPLKDVLEYIGETQHVQLYIYKHSLEEAGIDPATKSVTIGLKHVRISKLLSLILGELDLGYMIEDGIVFVGTKDFLNSHLVTQVYDCRKLLERDVAAATTPLPGPVAAPIVDQARAPSSVDNLMELICASTAPDTWTGKGGMGSISVYHGLLVINQTAEVQRQIADLLDQISSRLDSKPAR